MSSQKSTAVEPKRARGRARVEAILVAAGQVFAEQGYDRATMTEIAARSSTAIGSLYRLFPAQEGPRRGSPPAVHRAFGGGVRRGRRASRRPRSARARRGAHSCLPRLHVG